MADLAVYGFMKRILEKLGSPEIREIGLRCGFAEDLQGIQATFSLLKDKLLHVDAWEGRDWIQELEFIVSEVDELLDEICTEIIKNRGAKKVRILFSLPNQLAFRCRMIPRIQRVRRMLLDALAYKTPITQTSGIQRNFMVVEDEGRAKVHTLKTWREEVVVGRDADRLALVELLLDPENVSVIAICGAGGVGKTTLARLLYNDENVVKHFEVKIWVCVPLPFDVKRISESILESANHDLGMDWVNHEPRKAIDGKKYLLVLDDVWSVDLIKWIQLKELLMGGARGSKILVTTRNQTVTEVIGSDSSYPLHGLSEQDSWSLFKQVAFEYGVEPGNPTLLQIATEILTKSGGLPLAIRLLGGLFHPRDAEEKWLHFKQLLCTDQTESGILAILNLCYYALPAHLKQCFTYCSVFPEDHIFDKQTLIHLWMAQGFIQLPNEKQLLENVGDQYFMDLLSRSIFQDVIKDSDGNVISCKMHGIIHDLAKSMAGWESFGVVLDAQNYSIRNQRICVSDPGVLTNMVPSLSKGSKFRTLISATEQWGSGSEKELEYINKAIASLKCLRVLDLHKLGMKMVPRSTSALMHLKYLDLSDNCFQLLPKCICGLLNLETLKLNGCKYLKELPRETKNLVSLRHLEIEGCRDLSHMPCGLGQLTCLQTLSRFVVGRKDECTVGGLIELKSLVNIQGDLSIERLGGSIVERRKKHPNHCYLVGLEFLKSLRLFWNSYEPDELLFESLQPHPNLKKLDINNYWGVNFPSWMMVDIGLSFPNMTQISLWNCEKCQYLPPFGLLPSLQFLSLWHMNSLEYIDNEEGCGEYDSSSSLRARKLFPSLKLLHLSNLEQLKGLGSRRKRREVIAETTSSSAVKELLTTSFGVTQHLTALELLQIESCPELDLSLDDKSGIGLDFQGLSSLTSLSITNMPQLVSLPLWLQSITSLQSLEIESCGNLTNLPEWMGNLRSLQKLQFRYCESLTSLSQGMHCLTALQELIVVGCSPILNDRCLVPTGEDWHNIAHIPYIYIREKFLDDDLEDGSPRNIQSA